MVTLVILLFAPESLINTTCLVDWTKVFDRIHRHASIIVLWIPRKKLHYGELCVLIASMKVILHFDLIFGSSWKELPCFG